MISRKLPHYQFAKIKSTEIWRLYIDMGKQLSPSGIQKGKDLFEDEKGYMKGMMRSHRYLNNIWHKILTPETLIAIHALAIHKVMLLDSLFFKFHGSEGESITKFRDRETLSIGLQESSVSGIIEYIDDLLDESQRKKFKLDLHTLSITDETGLRKTDYDTDNNTYNLLYYELSNFENDFISDQTLIQNIYDQQLHKYNKLESEIAQLNKEINEVQEEIQNHIHNSTYINDIQPILQEKKLAKKELKSASRQLFYDARINNTKLQREFCFEKLAILKETGRLYDFATHLTKIKTLIRVPPRFNHQENFEIAEGIINEYLNNLKCAEDKNSKLSAIISFIRNLERLHPFLDGNTRTFSMLLLNRELILNGFPPTILPNPNHLALDSLSETVTEIKKGWDYLQKFESPIPLIEAYKELYMFCWEQGEIPKDSMTDKLQTFLLEIKDKDINEATMDAEYFVSQGLFPENSIENKLLLSLLFQLTELRNNIYPRI